MYTKNHVHLTEFARMYTQFGQPLSNLPNIFNPLEQSQNELMVWPCDIPNHALTTLPVRCYGMLKIVSTRLNIATTFPFVPKMFKPFETRLPFYTRAWATP